MDQQNIKDKTELTSEDLKATSGGLIIDSTVHVSRRHRERPRKPKEEPENDGVTGTW